MGRDHGGQPSADGEARSSLQQACRRCPRILGARLHLLSASSVGLIMNAAEHPRWTEIKVAMLVHVPFFSSLLFDMMDVQIGKFPHIFGGLTPTAATDGKRIYIDEDFLSGLKLPESVFLVCHEIGHAMWMHMARAKGYSDLGFEGEQFDPRRWNHAGDYVINDMLKTSQIGEMPKGGLHNSKYPHTMQVEDVYRDLKDKMPPQRKITITIGQTGNGQQAESDGND